VTTRFGLRDEATREGLDGSITVLRSFESALPAIVHTSRPSVEIRSNGVTRSVSTSVIASEKRGDCAAWPKPVAHASRAATQATRIWIAFIDFIGLAPWLVAQMDAELG
jgi:hypothetical protein